MAAIGVEIAMQWEIDTYNWSAGLLTNNIPQADGGTHLTGLRTAMTWSSSAKYLKKIEIAKKAKVDITGDDMREGLACVLSVKMPDPEVRFADRR